MISLYDSALQKQKWKAERVLSPRAAPLGKFGNVQYAPPDATAAGPRLSGMRKFLCSVRAALTALTCRLSMSPARRVALRDQGQRCAVDRHMANLLGCLTGCALKDKRGEDYRRQLRNAWARLERTGATPAMKEAAMVRLISEFQSWDRSAVAAESRACSGAAASAATELAGLVERSGVAADSGWRGRWRQAGQRRAIRVAAGWRVRHAAVRRPAGRRFPSGPARAGDGACHRRHHQDKRRCDRQCRQAFVAGRGRRGRRDTPGGGAGFAGRVRQAGRLRGRPGQDHRRPPAAGSSRDPYGGAGVAGRREQRGGEAGFLLPRVHTPGREKGLGSIAFPAISTGVYGYPRKEAAAIAVAAVRQAMQESEGSSLRRVVFCCYDDEDARLHRQLLSGMRQP